MAEIATAKAVTWEQARFIVNKHKTEENVAGLIRSWALAYPNELVALERLTKAYRRENAYMSPGKTMAHIGEIPRTLYGQMQLRYGRDWLNNQDLASTFFRHFRVGMTRPNSTANFAQ